MGYLSRYKLALESQAEEVFNCQGDGDGKEKPMPLNESDKQNVEDPTIADPQPDAKTIELKLGQHFDTQKETIVALEEVEEETGTAMEDIDDAARIVGELGEVQDNVQQMLAVNGGMTENEALAVDFAMESMTRPFGLSKSMFSQLPSLESFRGGNTIGATNIVMESLAERAKTVIAGIKQAIVIVFDKLIAALEKIGGLVMSFVDSVKLAARKVAEMADGPRGESVENEQLYNKIAVSGKVPNNLSTDLKTFEEFFSSFVNDLLEPFSNGLQSLVQKAASATDPGVLREGLNNIQNAVQSGRLDKFMGGDTSSAPLFGGKRFSFKFEGENAVEFNVHDDGSNAGSTVGLLTKREAQAVIAVVEKQAALLRKVQSYGVKLASLKKSTLALLDKLNSTPEEEGSTLVGDMQHMLRLAANAMQKPLTSVTSYVAQTNSALLQWTQISANALKKSEPAAAEPAAA